MTALTTFDRKPTAARHHSAVTHVPLSERLWVRLTGVVIVVSWGLGCVFAFTWLAT